MPETINEAKKSEIADESHPGVSLKDLAQVVYLCQILSFLFGVTAIAGIIINYLKRDQAKGTWLESHFTWQIRTFWFGLMWSAVGFITLVFFIGFFVLLADAVWILYRAIKGWLLLRENKPIGLGSVKGNERYDAEKTADNK